MPSFIVDIGALILVLGMTYALASEGLWGACLMFFNSLFAGLIALNFYEPLAAFLGSKISALSGYADTLCLLLIYTICLTALRLSTDKLGPTMVRFPNPVYHIGRWLFAFLCACATTGILLLAFHNAPVHKKMFYGAWNYDHKPPFGLGLDWQWLGLMQYSSGYIFSNHNPNNTPDPFGEFGTANAFDPRGRWLIDHQNARPYGEGFVPEAGSGAAATASTEGADGSTGAPPGSPSAKQGPGIPGGTAGAAAGLAPTNF